MVTARALPRPLSIGLLVLAALIALAVLSLNSTLTVIAPSMSHPPATTITAPDQAGPQDPMPSVRSGDGLSATQRAEQGPAASGRGVTRFADGGPDVAAPPPAKQNVPTCGPKCPPKPAR